MWLQFLLENLHFAIHLFAALVFFAVFWLYYDAWLVRREKKELIKLTGLFIISLSFVIQSVVVESTLVSVPLFAGVSMPLVASAVRVIGYCLLIASLVADPLMDEPDVKILVPFAGMISVIPVALLPVLASTVALLYLRRATEGLENHLKPLSYSFALLSVSELFGMGSLFASSTNVSLYELTRPFGWIWIISQTLLAAAVFLLCRWVFGYLLKQFQAQLFMIYTTTILVIFLITTVSFTGLLLNNMESEALRQIETDGKVLEYTIQSQKDQNIADAQSVANDTAIDLAIEKSDRKSLGDLATGQLISKKLSTLLVIGESGQVLARGEDRERVGDSLSVDPLLKRGLFGESVATVVSKDGVIAPDLSIRAVAPIKNASGVVSGAVIVGRAIDTAFVDGMKKATGLDASIYGDNIVSATTFTSTGTMVRLTGMKEEHETIKTTVLQKGKAYVGSLPIRSTVYTSAFLPLKDVDGNAVGMLFVGRPQLAILQAAGTSIQYTFIITALLIVVSIAPAYWISRFIADQL